MKNNIKEIKIITETKAIINKAVANMKNSGHFFKKMNNKQ
jgi:hypothetical protein